MKERSAKNLLEWLNNSTLLRLLLLFASGWALIQVLAYFETVIVIFTFAAIVAFLLSYPVRWLHRFLPHGVAVTLVFLVGMATLIGLTVSVGLAVLSQGQELIESLINFSNSMIPFLEGLEKFLIRRNVQVDLNAIQEGLRDQILSGLGLGLGYGLTTLQLFFSNLLNFILIAVVTFFMLLDGERLWNLIVKAVPSHLQHRFTALTKRNFLGFFRGQMLLSRLP